MHRLEDIRVIEDCWSETIYVCQVDEYGQATVVVRKETFPDAIPQTARPMFSQLYRCDACDQEFDSWEQTRLHIVWDDQQRARHPNRK